MDDGDRVAVVGLFLDYIRAQPTWLPADDRVFARLGNDKVSEPVDTVDVVAVNISRVECGKILEYRGERATSVLLSVAFSFSVSNICRSSRGRS